MNTNELIARLKAAAQEEIMFREAGDTFDLWQDEASPESVLALVEELESAQRKIAELEVRTLKLPEVENWRPVREVCGQYSYRALVIKSLSAADIKCEVKGE